MRRSAIVWLGAVLSLGFGSAADAADMPLKAPVLPPSYDWSGPYAGIAGGIAFGRSVQSDAGLYVTGGPARWHDGRSLG